CDIAKFERSERAVRCERFPDGARVFRYAAGGIELAVIVRLDYGFLHCEEIGKLLQRDEGAAAAKIFPVKSALPLRDAAFPPPEYFRVAVPFELDMRVATSDAIVERGKRNIFYGK